MDFAGLPLAAQVRKVVLHTGFGNDNENRTLGVIGLISTVHSVL